MKVVISFIRPNMLDDVTFALHRLDGLPGMSVSDIKGFGRRSGKDQNHPQTEDLIGFIPYVRIEIVCGDDLVEQVIETIRQSAHTGLHGDGKMYVGDITQAVRISTGETGNEAV
ncbi:P-II family nitrogen regulator [Planctomycetota bacterium]